MTAMTMTTAQTTPGLLAPRVREYLRHIAARAEPITYKALADALELTPPNTLHQVAMALEHLMQEDAANGHPFIAALVISKARDGLPAPGFFDCASRLGRFESGTSGPETSEFYGAELAAAVAFWSAASDTEDDGQVEAIALEAKLASAASALSGQDGDKAVDTIDVEVTWQTLASRPGSQLIDVRTRAEWAYVGIPDLAALGKRAVLVEWQTFPDQSVDPLFAERLARELRALGVKLEDDLFFICRSGGRSLAAASAMAAAGYSACHNVGGGFEGPLDDERHRGSVGGWKVAGLPWIQG